MKISLFMNSMTKNTNKNNMAKIDYKHFSYENINFAKLKRFVL